jgi:hypothetical protein
MRCKLIWGRKLAFVFSVISIWIPISWYLQFYSLRWRHTLPNQKLLVTLHLPINCNEMLLPNLRPMDGVFCTKTLIKPDRGVDSISVKQFMHENKKKSISWKFLSRLSTHKPFSSSFSNPKSNVRQNSSTKAAIRSQRSLRTDRGS